ncbi:hypothetical protein H8356DRAFT_874786, partial [Neocallimastix lanati (nom. inval.)]
MASSSNRTIHFEEGKILRKLPEDHPLKDNPELEDLEIEFKSPKDDDLINGFLLKPVNITPAGSKYTISSIRELFYSPYDYYKSNEIRMKNPVVYESSTPSSETENLFESIISQDFLENNDTLEMDSDTPLNSVTTPTSKRPRISNQREEAEANFNNFSNSYSYHNDFYRMTIENNYLKQQIMSKDLLINKLMDENRILKFK